MVGSVNGNSTKLEGKAENILGFIQVVGSVVSVIGLMAIGIKYMLGSIEEKAEYKQTMIPYIIGMILVFSGSVIPQIIYQIAKNF